jgi:ribosomal protein L37E
VTEPRLGRMGVEAVAGAAAATPLRAVDGGAEKTPEPTTQTCSRCGTAFPNEAGYCPDCADADYQREWEIEWGWLP